MLKKMMMLVGFLGMSWQVFAFDLNQIQIHGFASQGYLQSDHYDYFGMQTEDGTIEFNEFGLNVMSTLSDKLHMGLQVFARDFEDIGNDKVTIDWAFGEYRHRNWLGLRVGKFRNAFGLYNQSRDVDAARVGVFLPSGVYSEVFRSMQKSMKGVAAFGMLPGEFEYQVQYGTIDPEAEEEILELPFERVNILGISEITSVDVSDDAYVLSLTWNAPVSGLKLTGSIGHVPMEVTIPYTAGEVTLEVDTTIKLIESTIGFEYLHGPLTCAAEYLQVEFDGQKDQTFEAYYVLANYRFTAWFELGTSYAVDYMNKDDRDGDSYKERGQPRARAWLKDLAVSARFDLNEYWLIKLEGHWLNGLNGVSGYEGDDPSENGFLVAAKMTFSF